MNINYANNAKIAPRNHLRDSEQLKKGRLFSELSELNFIKLEI